jgi:uncharacterized protein
MSVVGTKLLCEVYKSPVKDQLYLYVAKDTGLTRVPEALLAQFGKPHLCLSLLLSPERQLARVSAARVLEQIAAQGFYLQLPPQEDGEMARVHQHNSKLWGG